jgi:hypothetical protein
MAVREGWHGGLEIVLHLPRTQTVGADGYSATDRLAFWNAAHLVVLAVATALTWLAWRRIGHAFGLYGAAILVVLLSAPSTGFPLTSLPRFLLTDFPVLIAIATLVQGRPGLRTGVFVGLGAASAAAGIAFARGVWIA